LPTVDQIGVDAGIDAATGALIGDNTTTQNQPEVIRPSAPATGPPAPAPAPAPAAANVTAADANTITKTVMEGDLVSFPNLKATDPDGDKITYTFAKPLDSTGKWQTKVGDAGQYPITIGASDGKSSTEQKVLIIVKSANRPPIIKGPDSVTGAEGGNIVLGQEISDPDGDQITVTYSGWMNASSKNTASGDAGDHTVTITASDGKATTTKTVKVTITKTDRAPVIADLTPITVKEGDKVTVIPQATDPDGDKISFAYGQPLDDRGVWQTKAGDAGTYNVNVTVSDGQLTDSTVQKITVTKLNKPPVIANFSDMTVAEGDTVTLNPMVTDPDGDKVTLVYSGWMTGPTKQVDYDQAEVDNGKHQVTLTATDTAGNTLSTTITITVKDANRPPIFDPNAFS
jgi:VCBS repeat-containing protein